MVDKEEEKISDKKNASKFKQACIGWPSRNPLEIGRIRDSLLER